MKPVISTLLFLVLLSASLCAQSGSIHNTLGSGGMFTIKDGSTTFLTLNQSDGNLGLSRSLALPSITGSTLGVIFKGANRFIHDYNAPGTDGYNTFVGADAGNFTMSGSGNQASNNTAVGYSSLTSLTTGLNNSAFGVQSLYSNTTGGSNSAFGYSSLVANTTGSGNSAFGSAALNNNTIGTGNSAFGYNALKANTTEGGNSAFGFSALSSNTSYNNSAFGSNSLPSNNAGTDNSAFGTASLYANTTGQQNSAFGSGSLNQATGSCNSAFGYSAGSTLQGGANNTCIGCNAQPSTSSVSNEITLGNSSIATLRCNVQSISSLSDARDKRSIRDLPLGLDFLMNVKPRLFNWDRREWYNDGRPDGTKMQATPTAGFIAQELDEVQTKEGAEWLNLVLKSNPNRLEATPGNLLPIMVKAIQELKAENDALKARLARLEQAFVTAMDRIRSESSAQHTESGLTQE